MLEDNMNITIEILGFVAGACTTVAVIPQIIKSLRTKEVKDVSPVMFGVLMLGVGLWVIYGVFKNDLPIIITNGLSFSLNSVMFGLMLLYRKRK